MQANLSKSNLTKTNPFSTFTTRFTTQCFSHELRQTISVNNNQQLAQIMIVQFQRNTSNLWTRIHIFSCRLLHVYYTVPNWNFDGTLNGSLAVSVPLSRTAI